MNDWFYDDVAFVCINNLFKGVSETLFSPSSPMSRGMMVTVLHRLTGLPNTSGSNPFTDVPNDEYYTDAVIWASQLGMVNGVGDNRFAPDDSISRQDLATILARYSEAMNITLPNIVEILNFHDSADISGYAKTAVSAMQRAGVINGKPDEIFDPLGNATRAEVAAMLHRFIIAAL